MLMTSIFEITSKVSTPLALAGVVVAVLFFIFRHIIQKNIFPKLTVAFAGNIIQSIIDKVFILAIVAIVLGFSGYVVAKFAPLPNLPTDSISISLPAGTSFQEAVKMIAANDSHTAVFSKCREALLGAKVEAGSFGGKTSKDLIEVLQYRFIDAGMDSKYDVEHIKEKGIYEIHCY